MADFERKLIPLSRLRLNNENDRHGPLPAEHECIAWLLSHHRNHILNLARNIAKYGISPIEGILVLPIGDEAPEDYVVWEGNRRIAALKLLDDPNRCHDGTLRRRFGEIASNAAAPFPEEVECTIAPSLEEAERLIELRHQGPQDGIGTVSWDPKQKDRHQQRLGKRGRYAFSHQILDAISDKLDDQLRAKVQATDFPISTLDRILKNVHAREFLGLSTEGGSPERLLEERETLKGLTKMLTDIANGMKVSKVYSSDAIRDYLGEFDKKDTPDKKKTLGEPVPLATDSQTEPAAKHVGTASTRSKPLSRDRKKLIPSTVSYAISDKRINAIYHELRRIDDDTGRNAVAVLFRVFLELSTELYLDKRGIEYSSNDKLAPKIQRAVEDMKKQSWLDSKRSKGINSASSSKHGPHSIDTFHAYVHDRYYHPEPSALNTAWDNIQPYFDALFEHLK